MVREHEVAMSTSESYIAFSYHYSTDYPFIRWVASKLNSHQVPTWFLENYTDEGLASSLDIRTCDPRYQVDWRQKENNWHAVFLRHLIYAKGVIIVTSEGAALSMQVEGRGMWREGPAIDFVRNDNPSRVRVIKNPAKRKSG